jgi:hypothetical protein
MSIDDALDELSAARSIAHHERAQRSAPKGWEAGIDASDPNYVLITTGAIPQIEAEDDWRAVAETMMQIPSGYRVRLVEAKHDPAAWHRDEQGEDAVTRPIWRYRFVVEPHLASLSADEIVSEIKKWKPNKRKLPTGSCAYIIAPGDLQLGKIDGGGSAAIVERFQEKILIAVERLTELRKSGRDVGEIVLALLGDCIEGYNSQGGRLAKRTDLSLTEMVRVYRRLVLWAIEQLAPLTDRLVVIAIPGNHDEAVRIGNDMATSYDDSWAIEGVVAVQDGLEKHSPVGFSHVSFAYPAKDELTVTLDVCGTIIGFAHGHQFKGGWEKWWSGQAHGCQPIGDATLLMAGHLHHLQVIWGGTKTFIQVPALDGGSVWWRHRTGQDSPAGLVTLVTRDGAWSDMSVL